LDRESDSGFDHKLDHKRQNDSMKKRTHDLISIFEIMVEQGRGDKIGNEKNENINNDIQFNMTIPQKHQNQFPSTNSTRLQFHFQSSDKING